MSAPATIVVIPTYNERANLPVLIEGLLRHDNVRALVVDDQSPDGTGQLGDELARANPGRIDVMHRTGKRGFGRSYVDGMAFALRQPVELICSMDADLSHDPAQLPDLIRAAAHADVVIGSRYVPGGQILNWPVRRKVLSHFANNYIRAITRLTPHDCTSGYRCWRRSAVAAIPLDQIVSDGYSFLVELLFKAAQNGATFAETPITFVERREGQSKLSYAVLLESMITPWRLAATRGGRVR